MRPELQAFDTADLLILTTAAERIRSPRSPAPLPSIGDRHGALTLGAVGVLGAEGVRTYQDPCSPSGHSRATRSSSG